MGSDTALLIIDVQVGFIEGYPSVYNAANILQRIRDLIARGRSANIPIIYVEHATDPEIDGPIHPDVTPSEGDLVVQKHTPDAFYQTPLQKVLEAIGVKSLIIAGFQTELCIDTTVRRAWSMEYDVTLVEDTHSTFTLDKAALTAPQIIDHHTRILREFATVKQADEIQFENLRNED